MCKNSVYFQAHTLERRMFLSQENSFQLTEIVADKLSQAYPCKFVRGQFDYSTLKRFGDDLEALD